MKKILIAVIVSLMISVLLGVIHSTNMIETGEEAMIRDRLLDVPASSEDIQNCIRAYKHGNKFYIPSPEVLVMCDEETFIVWDLSVR